MVGENDLTTAVPVVVSLISAMGAIFAAILASRSAHRAKTSELREQRLGDMEARLAVRKADVYEPMVELMRRMLDPATAGKMDKQGVETFAKFSTWVQIYGSDEAVRVFHKLMQAAYHEPPPEILMRYLAEFTLAIRRDLGHVDTGVGLRDLLGIRLKDIYELGDTEFLEIPEAELAKRHSWERPWGSRFGD
jgi:hypothetical protein